MAGGSRANAQGVVALAMASGKTAQDAASAAGVSDRTVFRWMALPDFRHRVQEMRTELTSAATGRLSASMGEAADRLGALVKSLNEKVALSASRAVLELAVKLRESDELEARVAELETAFASRVQGKRQARASGHFPADPEIGP